MVNRKIHGIWLALPLLAGAARAPAAGLVYAAARIEGVPHVRQKPDFCGEACAEMALRRLGCAISQDEVFDRSGVPPGLGRGCYTRELVAALGAIGFRTGPVFATVAAARAAEGLEGQWRALHADLTNGIPSIVCMRYDDSARAPEHFRLVWAMLPQATRYSITSRPRTRAPTAG